VRKARQDKTEIRDASLDADPDFLLSGHSDFSPAADDFVIRLATKHFAALTKPFFAVREEMAKP